MAPSLHRHPDAQTLTEALSAAIMATLSQALDARGQAGLVVSGGSTPRAVLARLATCEAGWEQVWVTLADERWVPPDADASNERLVRQTLLRHQASRARFVPLYNAAAEPEQAQADCAGALAGMPRPFDLVLLGMGADGHTASLFPGVSGAGLDRHATTPCVAVRPTDAAHARLSLTLPTLLDSRQIVLLINGAEKWRVYEQALQPGPIDAMPVRGVLHQDQTPVSVYWCP